MPRTRTLIAAAIYGPVGAVLFGIGAVPVLSIPVLRAQAADLIPYVVIASLALAFPIALAIVPRMRSRRWARRNGAG
jgi:hypothetical protein